MLPFDTREQIRESIVRGTTPGRQGFVVGVPIEHSAPDVNFLGVRPALRWGYQDIESREPPFQEVILRTGENVIESDAPADLTDGRYLGATDVSDGPRQADIRVEQGRPVRDELVLSVVAVGQRSETIRGESVTVPDRKLAGAITRAVYEFLTNRWKTRPLDAFDRQGNLVDQSGLIYADELPVPVLPKPDPMRGPSDVTGQVGRDDGSQWDCKVDLHYWDTHLDWEFSPTDAEVDTELQQ